MTSTNGFGAQTYWNQPLQGRQRKLSSKYSSLKMKVNPSSRPPSPTLSQQSTRTLISPSRPVQNTQVQKTQVQKTQVQRTQVRKTRNHVQLTQKSDDEENDEKDENSFVKIMKSTLPQFSNEADWEMAIFELGLILDRVWPHKDDLDIMYYMTTPNFVNVMSYR